MSESITALALRGIGGETVTAMLKAFIEQAPSPVARGEVEKVLGKLEDQS